jgi:hypothetical protein
MHSGPTLRPLAEPLRLAAIELADLAALGDQLQRAIGRLTASQGAPRPPTCSASAWRAWPPSCG